MGLIQGVNQKSRQVVVIRAFEYCRVRRMLQQKRETKELTKGDKIIVVTRGDKIIIGRYLSQSSAVCVEYYIIYSVPIYYIMQQIDTQYIYIQLRNNSNKYIQKIWRIQLNIQKHIVVYSSIYFINSLHIYKCCRNIVKRNPNYGSIYLNQHCTQTQYHIDDLPIVRRGSLPRRHQFIQMPQSLAASGLARIGRDFYTILVWK